MEVDALCKLLVSAFAKFLAADMSIDRARFGLFGIWVGDQDHCPVAESDSQHAQALASRDAWSEAFADFSNPYSDLVMFYQTGAYLGRWENMLLCVYGPDGQSAGGIPLSSLIEAANDLR